MITVHHLNNSRSQRILWLLEELGLDYEIVKYQRDTETNLAPPELKKVHPLGKSPVITDGGLTLAESGAIIQYLVDTYGDGRLQPAPGTREAIRHLEWMHFAEGSAVLPLLLGMYVSRLGEAGGPLWPRIGSEVANHLGYMDSALEGQEFFVGDDLTAADIQLTFVLEGANVSGALKDYPNLAAYLERMQARPAYLRAVERGGSYRLGS